MSFSKDLITSDVAFNIAIGRFEGQIIKGRKFAISKEARSDAKDVWSLAYNLTYPSAAETLYAWSTDPSDTSVIELHGVTGDYTYQRASIALNGLTPVAFPGTWLRSFDIHNHDGPVNLGEIYVSPNAGGVVVPTEIRAHADAGLGDVGGASAMSHYTVPKGYVGLIKFYSRFAPNTADVEYYAYFRMPGGIFALSDLGGQTPQLDLNYLVFPAGTDFKVMVRSPSTINRLLSIAYAVYLVKEEYYNEAGTRPQGNFL